MSSGRRRFVPRGLDAASASRALMARSAHYANGTGYADTRTIDLAARIS